MRQSTFNDIFIEYYQGIILFGAVMVAISLWLYSFHYIASGDDVVGFIAACALFFGTLLIGQGIRGWRDGMDFRHRFIKMKSKHGAELEIKRKKKRKW